MTIDAGLKPEGGAGALSACSCIFALLQGLAV